MLLGRAVECARIDRLLSEATAGRSGALLVWGDPGIGKTALLEYAAHRAEGMAVVRARGVESEAQVPFAGLLELLRPLLGELERLPDPQAVALRSALGLGPGAETDRFMIGAATLSVLAAAAERSPLLVLVDDLQWLDPSSAAAIVFSARRLLADAVAMVLAARREEAEAVPAAGLPRLRLEGLDRTASEALLDRHAGRAVSAEFAEQLFLATAGNPLALVELASEAPERAADLLGVGLTTETGIERAFLGRSDALPRETRRALVVAAAVASGEMGTIQRASERLGIDPRALEEAERMRLVVVSDARLEFRHPLVRSAFYHAAAPPERRAVHRAIAETYIAERDLDSRAYHLAAATFGPDESVAAALEQAAIRAAARGGHAAAASALERAARLTPDEEDRPAQHLVAAADAAWAAGDTGRTMRLVDEALERCSGRRLRADGLRLKGYAEMQIGPVMRGHDTLVEAAAQIEPLDPGKAVELLAEAADACTYAARPETMLITAQRAWDLVPADARDREKAFARLALGTALIFNGHGRAGAQLLHEATQLVGHRDALGDDPRLLARAAIAPLWLREAGIGNELIERALEAARAQNALGAMPLALQIVAVDSAASDRWAFSKARHHEAIALARDAGHAVRLCGLLAGLARIEARQGQAEVCRSYAEEAIALARRLGLDFYRLWAITGLGDLELAAGHLDEALRWLQEAEGILRDRRIGDPDIWPAPELVEVWLRLGDRQEAQRVTTDYLARAEQKRQPWSLARATRCRALLATAEAYDGAFHESLRYHELTVDAFELARTQLCYGERLRRDKRRLDAREQLRAAFACFERLGAVPWAERARVELQATGETARRRDASTIDQLTPQELQIATVLADGLTTREAAARLYLSPKTVEYHLRNAYRKLGIRTRRELLAALAGEAGTHVLPRRLEAPDQHQLEV
jgi:DNA-binding CsgD family transcriptional regulator